MARLLEEMPCRPRQIKISPYTLPIIFDGHLEPEEAAARIISFSQRENEWVGVTWQRLLTMMKNDIAANNQRFALRERARKQDKLAKQPKPWPHYLLWPILRLYSFVFSPKQPAEPFVSVSGIYSYGIPFVRRGIRFLINGQWIRQEILAGNFVYYPTPKLIKRIVRKYNISAD